MAISGSVPPGIVAGAHRTLIEVVHARGGRSPSTSPAARLIEAAAAGADLVSPNLAEAEQALDASPAADARRRRGRRPRRSRRRRVVERCRAAAAALVDPERARRWSRQGTTASPAWRTASTPSCRRLRSPSATRSVPATPSSAPRSSPSSAVGRWRRRSATASPTPPPRSPTPSPATPIRRSSPSSAARRRGARAMNDTSPLRRRAPTVTDVAGRAGVSPKTVSRALNNEGNVRPDKIDRVRRAAAELGFRPNQFARLLRTRGTASMVGVVTASVGDPFWTGVLQGVEAVIGGGDRFILSASTRDRSDREPEIVKAMVERRVMALLVVPTAVDQSYLGAIVADGTPVVCIDRPAVGADVDAVVADDVGGVRRGMKLLVARRPPPHRLPRNELDLHHGAAARGLSPGARRGRHRRRRRARAHRRQRSEHGRRRSTPCSRSPIRRPRSSPPTSARRSACSPGCANGGGHRRSSPSATSTRRGSTIRR